MVKEFFQIVQITVKIVGDRQSTTKKKNYYFFPYIKIAYKLLQPLFNLMKISFRIHLVHQEISWMIKIGDVMRGINES